MYGCFAPQIVEWVDVKLAHSALDDLWDGYKDEAAKDESRAWVALLEGNVHAALPPRSFFQSLFDPPSPPSTAQSLLVPPPISGFFPSYSITFLSRFRAASNNPNSRVSPAMRKAIFNNYADAIKALSEKPHKSADEMKTDIPLLLMH
ncbi:hypothetical protein BDP27DRAFT_1416776 [Rhodocollybia butyracea]|uniref:Uncharacterized protein n=1 Tax=Rhodocollybia butyracea TaxID=206335 RepID=A0A9P5Q514_9AGAR|nr:hypothetical protein BDP27DRAFT_1416776 [Rhodocollybia butyracea]